MTTTVKMSDLIYGKRDIDGLIFLKKSGTKIGTCKKQHAIVEALLKSF